MPPINLELTESLARALGMVSVPMFGASRAKSVNDRHHVLLDGDRASCSYSVGNPDRLLSPNENPLSWSWSANLRRTLIFDNERRILFVKRWDKKDYTESYPDPDLRTVRHLVESFDADDPLPIPTV